MSARQTRRLLIVAFAISLIVHVLVATRINWPFASPKDQVQEVRIERMRTLRVSRIPTPPPATPPPVSPSPHPSAVATSAATSKAKSLAKNGKGAGAPGNIPRVTAPPPTPIASPTTNCASTDTAVTLASKPEQPDISALARADAASGITSVHVLLDANGVVTQAVVVQSSGNSSLDLVAVSMARGAHYLPATHACKPIAGDYTFKTKFTAW